ncbi:kinesin-like protein KIFC2 isoform X3 [Cervus elaphus]|uniref:kinesin-like protein KIFC2 isoform X3 n=1 Tax=Cervus elaphus TaxID=9860 RepID=UPI001CC2771D|nr:kinesin-like protein KIFC2 isoform X3 [Cervus elaphus]
MSDSPALRPLSRATKTQRRAGGPDQPTAPPSGCCSASRARPAATERRPTRRAAARAVGGGAGPWSLAPGRDGARWTLFRRDGGAAAAADAENPAQSARCKPGSRRRADQPTAELWTELTGLVGSSEAEDGSGGGAERCPAEVSLEEALVRLAEFLSVQLGAEESFGTPPDLSKPGDVPPLLTVTGQLLALLAWIRSPRGRQALSQGMQPVSGVQHPPPAGSPLQEESPSLSPRGDAQGQQPPQLEEDQRAWQRLEQLILGQLEELKQQLEHQEEELGQLRLGVGATDSEKRVQHLTLENKALKQSLSLTRDLLLHWGPAPHTRAPQEKAEALLELRGRLQEAQDTTEALRVQETEQNCRRELQQMRGQLAGLRARMASLRQGCGDLRGLVSTFTQSCQGSLSEAQGQVSWALGALSADGAGTQLAEAPQGPLPGCPGRLLELKGNIRVLCRLRPGTPSSLVSLEPGPGGTVTTCYRGHQRRFRLDWVFPPHASQEEVFRELESAVLSCLGGYSVCIFTYGQTGTGKTYSMEGPPEDPGIAPRALQSLFREMGTGGQHRVTLSMVEIYNEAVRSGAPGASRLAPSPNPFCLHPQAPQRSPALSHQGPPCPRASPAPGSEAGPSRPGGSPGGWPHPLGRAQPGVSAPGEAAQWGPAALQAPALTRTGGAGPAAGQPLSARPADAEPGEEQPGHRRHSHEPAQLSLARPGHADTAHSVPIARSWHRRHAAPRRPGGVRARLEGGGGRHIAGRPGRRPASTGGSDHQPLAAGAGRRDGRAAGPPAPRALPRLAAHTPTAAGAGPRRHGGAAAADLHAARGSRRDRVLAQVRRACEPSGVGAGQAPQGSPLRDTLLLEHRHTTLRDPLHPHDVARQPSKPRLRQRLQLGPGTAGGPAFLVLPKEPGSHLCGQRQQNPYSLMTSLISGDRCPPPPPPQSPPSSPTLEECSAWGNDHTSPAPLSPSAVIAAHSRGSQGRRCRPRPSGHQSHYPITTLDLD